MSLNVKKCMNVLLFLTIINACIYALKANSPTLVFLYGLLVLPSAHLVSFWFSYRHIHRTSQASSVTIGEFQLIHQLHDLFPLLRFKTEWSMCLTIIYFEFKRWTVTKFCQILTSLYVVFCFAQETHACAYYTFTHVTFLMHDINVVH
jgi:hypothetical protein